MVLDLRAAAAGTNTKDFFPSSYSTLSILYSIHAVYTEIYA